MNPFDLLLSSARSDARSNSRILYDRKVVLVVGKNQQDPKAPFVEALRIEGLRVTFRIEKSDKPEPNKSEIVVYNLSAQSRAALEGKGTPVVLLAGYASGVAQAFSGQARIVDSEKVGTDWATHIRCGDWERQYCTAQVSVSNKPGASVKETVLAIAKKVMTDRGNIVEKLAKAPEIFFKSGYAAHGLAHVEMTNLMGQLGLEWSIQDGRLQVLGPFEVASDEGPLFTPDTGLIGTPALGTPEQKGGPQTWRVRALLEPRLRPGQRFAVERTTRGEGGQPAKREYFRAGRVFHQGDTHGGDWCTEVEATQL